jgi:ABC-type dipeptide/oligopeptide/nickel transport system permease component
VGRYVVQRLAFVVPTLVLAATLAFIAVRVLPGDPAQVALGDYATRDAVEQLRAQMGLDEPLPIQYVRYLADLARGQLGTSFSTRRPVLEQVLRLAPYTLVLASSGAVLGLLLGVPAGIASALWRDSWLDRVVRLVSLAGIGLPIFYLGLLLLWVFGLNLGWFPLLGAGDWADPSDVLRHLVLPATVVGLNVAGLVMRVTRSSILEVIAQDYVRTARAKGLGSRAVLSDHALRNALIPIVTVVSLQAGNLLGGSVITEVVFGRPGVGKLLVDSVLSRDYPQVQAGILLFAAVFVLINLVTDMVYVVADPHIRFVGTA